MISFLDWPAELMRADAHASGDLVGHAEDCLGVVAAPAVDQQVGSGPAESVLGQGAGLVTESDIELGVVVRLPNLACLCGHRVTRRVASGSSSYVRCRGYRRQLLRKESRHGVVARLPGGKADA